MTDYDTDPEALAWARAKVQEVVGKAEECATNPLLTHQAREGWRQTAAFIRYELVSRDGAVYAAFDERWPSLANDAPAATGATEPASCPVDHCDPDHCGIHTTAGCTWVREPTEPARSALREQIAAAIYEKCNPGHRWVDAHPHDVLIYGSDADAVLTVVLPHGKFLGDQLRHSGAVIERVIALHERWVQEGPPPLGVPLARWWDKRLVELHDAIVPPTDQPKEK